MHHRVQRDRVSLSHTQTHTATQLYCVYRYVHVSTVYINKTSYQIQLKKLIVQTICSTCSILQAMLLLGPLLSFRFFQVRIKCFTWKVCQEIIDSQRKNSISPKRSVCGCIWKNKNVLFYKFRLALTQRKKTITVFRSKKTGDQMNRVIFFSRSRARLFHLIRYAQML